MIMVGEGWWLAAMFQSRPWAKRWVALGRSGNPLTALARVNGTRDCNSIALQVAGFNRLVLEGHARVVPVWARVANDGRLLSPRELGTGKEVGE